jgi:hypothetical protein
MLEAKIRGWSQRTRIVNVNRCQTHGTSVELAAHRASAGRPTWLQSTCAAGCPVPRARNTKTPTLFFEDTRNLPVRPCDVACPFSAPFLHAVTCRSKCHRPGLQSPRFGYDKDFAVNWLLIDLDWNIPILQHVSWQRRYINCRRLERTYFVARSRASAELLRRCWAAEAQRASP